MSHPAKRQALSLLAAGLFAGAGVASAATTHPVRGASPFTCPHGYHIAELHAVGNKFEAGIPPKGETPQVVVQHGFTIDGSQASTNGNYIPFLACARQWNDAEWEAANYNRSTGPVNYPFSFRK